MHTTDSNSNGREKHARPEIYFAPDWHHLCNSNNSSEDAAFQVSPRAHPQKRCLQFTIHAHHDHF